MNNGIDRNGRRALSLGLTAALHAVNHAVFNMLAPLALTLNAFFHFKNLTSITYGFSLYMVFYGFCQVPMGFLSDRIPRKTMLTTGTMLNAAAIAAAAAFPEYKYFLVCMAAAGTGAAAYHPVGAAYLSDLYSESKGTALGISGIGATVGLVAGPAAGGALCVAVGWRVTFLIFAAVGFVAGIVFYLFAAEPARSGHTGSESKRTAAASGQGGWSRALIFFLIAAAAVFTMRELAGWGSYYIVPIFSESIYGYSASAAGVIGGLQSIGGFFAQPLGGWLSDRIGRRRLMSVLLLFAAAFTVSVPFVGKGAMPVMVFLYGVAYTATVPIIDALIADRTPGSVRGAVFGIFMASGIGISAASPLLQAKIIDTFGASIHAFRICFTLLAAFLLVSMTLLLLFRGAENGKKA